MTALYSVVIGIHQMKKSGMLSVMVKVSKQLLKIYFIDGEIFCLLCGNLKNAECLSEVDTMEFTDCYFFSDAKLNTIERINIPTMEIIARLKASNKTVECKDMGGIVVTESYPGFSAIMDNLKAALVKQIGPFGAIVFPKVIDKWHQSSHPTKQGLDELVNLLKEEIDDTKNQAEFVKEANKIIS
jgi:hypothetical protein